MAATARAGSSPDEIFTEILGMLADLGYKEDIETTMAHQGFTKQLFVRECRVLRSYGAQRLLRKIAVEAIKKGALPNLIQLDAQQIVNLARWCNKEEGKNAIAALSELERFRKRAVDTITAQDFSRVAVFEVQRSDFNADVGGKREELEGKIQKLDRQIQMLRKEMDDCVDDKGRSYLSASRYVPMPPEGIARDCWQRYIREPCDCDSNLPIPAWNEANVLVAVTKYKDIVQQEHLAAYCAGKDVRDDLQKYLKEKIRGLETIGDFRLSKKYKATLASAYL